MALSGVGSVDAKISPPEGKFLRSTYARAREIYFALTYRTELARMWCARYDSQFVMQLTRRVDVRCNKLSASQMIPAIGYRRADRGDASHA